MKTTLLLLLVLGFVVPGTTTTVPEPTLHAVQSLKYAESVEPDHLTAVAVDAFEAAGKSSLFIGPRGVEATTLLLWAILYTESGIRPHIERCDCTKGDGDCDHGRALGLPQLHARWLRGRSESDVCSDRRLQLSLALTGPLPFAKSVCGSSLLATLGAYNAPGARCAVTKYGSTAYGVFEQLIAKAGIVVHVHNLSWSAESS